MSFDFNSLTDAEICTFIAEDRTGNLPDKDLDFAMSLIDSVRRRVAQGGGATEKQRRWLVTLAERTAGVAKPHTRATSAVGDLAGVMALFDRAKAHLKAPAIVISPDDPRKVPYPREWRLSVAGPKARVPGSINVLQKAARRGMGDHLLVEEDEKWFGRILPGGVFEASPREYTPHDLIPFLQRFAADPAAVAAEHGRLTGRCCFCNRGLRDDRSTAVGYGRTCADRFGLPWGVNSSKAA